MELNVNEDGYLKNPEDWNEEVMYELAKRDGLELTEEHIKYIMAYRDMYERDGVAPPIRTFCKEMGLSRKGKELYDLFKSGPTKRMAKYAGNVPMPTGCV
jgi:tRNA 2-thiouridine synthesizing protein E